MRNMESDQATLKPPTIPHRMKPVKGLKCE